MVARIGSFTKAAGQLNISQSALSYTVKMLEKRLQVKLLNRTTRSVSVTQEGEQLLNDIEPLINQIDQKLCGLNDFKKSPKGKLKINGTELSINYFLWDKLSKFSKENPDINLELSMDYGFKDIVKGRFDIGIRLGENLEKDMISVKVTDKLEMSTVASPEYLSIYGTPETPEDLNRHRYIGLRLPSYERVQSWEFKDYKNNKFVKISNGFSMVVSHARLQIKAGIDGLGIVWLPKVMIEEEVKLGKLIPILNSWDIKYSGYYMYYPHRRESSPLFRLLVDALRLD